MKPLPHHYPISVAASHEGPAEITSPGLTPLMSAPPPEFDGPGNLWSPETLTVAAVADCFVMTFKAIASASRFHWTKIVCEGQGDVDRAEDGIRFTTILLNARLELPAGGDADKARRLLEKAERACLVGNSLQFRPEVRVEITMAQPAPELLAR
jgi:organic hydroperoxide reductase OsmC/OhrA